MSQPEIVLHRQEWFTGTLHTVPTGRCMCGQPWTSEHRATWQSARPGDTPVDAGPMLPDVLAAVLGPVPHTAPAPAARSGQDAVLADRVTRLEQRLSQILAAAAHGYVQIANGLVAAATEVAAAQPNIPPASPQAPDQQRARFDIYREVHDLSGDDR